MKTTDQQFEGWVYDTRTERSCPAIRLRKFVKVLFNAPFGILVIAGIFKTATSTPLPHWLVLGCLAAMLMAIVLALVLSTLAKKIPPCTLCGKPMKILETIPSPSDADRKNYMTGPSGHVYGETSTGHSGGRLAMEIRQKWYACELCKSYVLLDPEVREIIGRYPEAIDEREQWYARTARDIADIARVLKKKRGERSVAGAAARTSPSLPKSPVW